MSQSIPVPEFDDEDLVAYLDGELDPERSRLVEELLASNPVLRARLNGLERAWGALDTLPVGEPTGIFTRSTIEMVLQDEGRVRSRNRRASLRWWSAVALLGLAPAVIAVSTFLAVRQKQLRPESELIRDLQVIQNIDAYDSVSDIGFLEMLQQAGVFRPEATDENP